MNESLTNTSGIIYPPKNKIAVNADINTILQYSARKKKTKIIPLCSVKKPATNSLSASGRSKGALFVSAIIEIKNINDNGNKGIIYQVLTWDSIILVKFKEPKHNTTVKITNPITTS